MITYEQLTPEQDAALEAPLDRPLVVTGPVGSGRSTVAMYRALIRVAIGHTALIVVPDLLRKFRLLASLDDRVGDRLRVVTVGELPGLLLPGTGPVRPTDSDSWVQLTMRAVERDIRSVSGGWAVLFDDAHDQPVRAVEFARLFDPAVTITVDPEVMVVGDNVDRRTTAKWVDGRGWNRIGLGSSHRLLPQAARLIAGLRGRPQQPTDRTSDEPALCLLSSNPTLLTAFVARLARRDRKQRIAVVCLHQEQFAEMSARLRHAVDERSYLPLFGGVTRPPTAKSAGPVVQLSEARWVRGNEFDVVVIAGLADRVDRSDNEHLVDALTRACGAAQRTIVFVTEDLVTPQVLAGLPDVDPTTLQIHRIQDVLAALAVPRRASTSPAEPSGSGSARRPVG